MPAGAPEYYIAVFIETTTSSAADMLPSCDEEIALIRASSEGEARAKAARYAQEKCRYESISGEAIELTYKLMAVELSLTDELSDGDVCVLYARGIADMDAYRRAFGGSMT